LMARSTVPQQRLASNEAERLNSGLMNYARGGPT
jgi:hypothetical protein